MVFAYYDRLTGQQRRIYRKSNSVSAIRLPNARQLQPVAMELAAALKQQDRKLAQSACQRLTTGVTSSLMTSPIRVDVLAVRPHNDWEELHGYYSPARARKAARITLWMRTARRRQVVAFRTFLRTLLHELCHHLDYELLGLGESFHTEGFYQRESSLFHQLVVSE